jgi:hypothetical protein
MGLTVDNPTLDQIIAGMQRAIQKLQKGARPIIGRSDITSLSGIVLATGAGQSFEVELSWPDENVSAMLGAVPYVTIYVDSDGSAAHRFPSGGSLSAGQKNLVFNGYLSLADLEAEDNKAKFVGYIKNNDSVGHTYFIDIAFTYNAGSSNAQ